MHNWKHSLLIAVGAIALVAVISVVAIKLTTTEDSWICRNGEWVKHGNPLGAIPDEICGPLNENGSITSFDDCVAAGYPVLESYPPQCRANGQTFTPDIGNEREKANLIRISSPRPNETVDSPLVVTGEARGGWYFEADFPVRLYDEAGQLLATAIAQAQSDWMTDEFVPFRAEISFTPPTSSKGVLVLEKDNPSGLPENADELRVPLNFNAARPMTRLQIYFSNDEMDPEITCNRVFAVEREVPTTPAIARAAIEQLLAGPSAQDQASGFRTNINPGTAIQSLTIQNGVARIDFNEQLDNPGGGSCRVSAIRAQITETLRQFPTVDEVVISVNGDSESALQP